MEKEKRARKTGRIITSVIGILICIILIPLLVMNITIIVKSYINPDEVPDFFGIKPFIVLTGSMEDTIGGGDLVITKETDPETLEVGDIISYSIGNSVVTHRIVEMTEVEGKPAFITKGDANNTEDEEPVTYDQVEGIYIFSLAGLGNIAMFMQTTKGMLICIGIPVVLFILYDVIRRKMDKKREEKQQFAAQTEIDALKQRLSEVKNETLVETDTSAEAGAADEAGDSVKIDAKEDE